MTPAAPGHEASQRPCLDANQVAGLCEGRLPDDERDALLAHVIACADCRDWVGAMGGVETRPEPVAEPTVERRVAAPRWSALTAAAAVLLGVGALLWALVHDDAPGASQDERLVAAARMLAHNHPELTEFAPLDATARAERPLGPERGGITVLGPRGSILSTRPQVAWSRVPGAERHRITIRDAEGALRVDVETTQPSWTWPDDVAALDPGAAYVARVRAITPAGDAVGSCSFHVLGADERARYERGLTILLAGSARDTGRVLAAHWAIRHGLWLEADRVLREGARGAVADETRALVDHHLRRDTP